MTYSIDIQNDEAFLLDAGALQRAAIVVLSAHEVAEDSALTVVVTTDEAVHALNQQHRGVDAPTDVLSFPADPLPFELEDDAPYLGDLVIAYPYALAQAQREGFDPADGLLLLVVHGTLHLLGYDHDTPDHRAEMWAAQAEALHELGVDVSIVPALEGQRGQDEGGA